MKAIVQHEYGGPDVLEFADVDMPELEEGRILVRMRSAAVNPYDWHMMTGSPWLVRTQRGWRRPTFPILGSDGAGVVEAVGEGVTGFAPGDQVWGSFRGSFAEFATTNERSIVHKPEEVSFEQAGSVAIAGLTALEGLRDVGGLETGQRVLINGASGGVGSFAVMIAKSIGAHVTAVCSPRNVEMVRGLGADAVVDYTAEDYTKGNAPYDLIFDTVTTRGVIANRRVMKPGGTWIQAGMKKKGSVAMLLVRMAKLKVSNLWSSKKMRSFLARTSKEDLLAMNELLERRDVVPVIDRRFPLGDTAEAMRRQGQGHASGKTVIKIG